MSASAVKVYVAHCEECDWESDESYDDEWDADRAAEAHNDVCPHAQGVDESGMTEREAFQAALDEAVERAKVAAA
ncbi:hypothetical protein [Microbacterium sp. zg-YB36]|uniref:hypothetical protein n=1 Tax=Microbacterium sp. zg-YB36 TaxID=2969407 RepID=UPI00214B91D2|nr:hypothetical protein [Microbacterium sp. zg-YB36]MDL5351119.1 hypothetical protein [Microbacterium sp. zg-YB36]